MLVSWASNESLAPVAASLHRRADLSTLQRQLTTLTRQVAGATLAVALCVALFAGPILGVFGAGFEHGASPLRLLCLAAVVNATASGNTTVLMMTGHERSAAAAAATGLLTTVVLSLVLIPAHGAGGAAVAILGGTAVRNFVACRRTWTQVGIESTVIGRIAADR